LILSELARERLRDGIGEPRTDGQNGCQVEHVRAGADDDQDANEANEHGRPPSRVDVLAEDEGR
jgi:hypothetical protein